MVVGSSAGFGLFWWIFDEFNGPLKTPVISNFWRFLIQRCHKVMFTPYFIEMFHNCRERCQSCAVEDGDTRVRVPDAGKVSGKVSIQYTLVFAYTALEINDQRSCAARYIGGYTLNSNTAYHELRLPAWFPIKNDNDYASIPNYASPIRHFDMSPQESAKRFPDQHHLEQSVPDDSLDSSHDKSLQQTQSSALSASPNSNALHIPCQS